MGKIETLTPQEATEILRRYGMRISPDVLRLGLQQGVYPFGVYIAGNGSPIYQIFRKQFNEWISEREM